jgi:beta-lactamase class A
MCSTFKASLAACVLASVDRGQTRLDDLIAYGPDDLLEFAPVAQQNVEKGAMSVADMCEAAVELSDNTCANVLLARVGGPSALTAFWRSIGDPVSRLDHNEPELNRSPPGDPHDTTTPAAMAGNLRSLILGKVLSPNSRERLTGWMLGCKTGDNRLRAGLPKGWRVGDKTGKNGKDAFGDIAVTWSTHGEPVLICAYADYAGFGDVHRLTVDAFAAQHPHSSCTAGTMFPRRRISGSPLAPHKANEADAVRHVPPRQSR